MPGVPTSRRCMSCKKRKVKCDLKWPCSSCKRLNVSCSGPQAPFKIILNGSHAAPVYIGDAACEAKITDSQNTADDPTAVEDKTNPWHVIETSYHQDKKSACGGSYGFFRLARSEAPRRSPVGDVDSLAAHLVSHMSTPSFADSATGMEFIKHVPQRLEGSAALRDSVALFIFAWTNYWRGAAPGELIDTRLQSRALRSLYRELESPRQVACETLAAVTLLQRLEVLMENGADRTRFVHSRGMLSLMARKGPPRMDDALDVRMALDNHRTPLGLWMVRSDESIFFDERWKDSIRKAAAIDDDEKKIGSTFSLEGLYWRWPPLVHETKALGELHKQGVRQGDLKFAARLRQLHHRAKDTLYETRLVGEAILGKACEASYIQEKSYPASPCGRSVHFHNVRYCKLLANYLVFQIMLLRMLRYVCRLQGLGDSDYEREYKQMSRRCLAFCPYLRQKGPIACAQYACTFFFAIGGLEGAERSYMIRFILDVTDLELGDEETAAAIIMKAADKLIGCTYAQEEFATTGPCLTPVSLDRYSDGECSV